MKCCIPINETGDPCNKTAHRLVGKRGYCLDHVSEAFKAQATKRVVEGKHDLVLKQMVSRAQRAKER